MKSGKQDERECDLYWIEALCSRMVNLFFGMAADGREERGREERENRCKAICYQCSLRLDCLGYSLVSNEGKPERYGVWGGLSEGDRRAFVNHYRQEGYDLDHPPQGEELLASLASFYRNRNGSRRRKLG